MKEIIVATYNKGKVEEFNSLLGPLGYRVLSMEDIFDEKVEIEENGKTFKENAFIKANTLMEMIHKPVIADDSGIEIDAFDKKPGVESARFLGHETSYEYKNQYILDHITEGMPRTARYVCAIAYCQPGKEPLIVQETFEGEIACKAEGSNGFGYDPIFYYPPLKKTAAQMELDEKNLYSHRAKALRKLLECLKGK